MKDGSETKEKSEIDTWRGMVEEKTDKTFQQNLTVFLERHIQILVLFF